MQNAKEAVKGFLSNNNKHSVDIEQTSSPAVTHERVQEARHENVTVAHDREIHQHHHQTHVQPIQDKVVEPEQHHHNVIPVEHRQHHHGKDREVELALQEQAGQFRDEQEVLPAQHSKSSNTVVGEHVHHHIHDTIQPVIERERLQQHVVHTTIPIHERIDKEPVIHSGNVLPTKTLEEFQASGHSLTGHHTKPEHIDYEGEPLKIKEDSRVGFDHHSRHGGPGTTGAPGELGTNTGHVGAAGITGHHHHQHGSTNAGPHDSNMGNKLDPRVDSDMDGSRNTGMTGTTGTGMTGSSGTGMTGSSGTGMTGSSGYGSGTTGSSTTAGPHNSNVANKMDPRVDSDMDGRSGMTGTTGNTGRTGTSSMLNSGQEGYGNTTSSGLGSGTTGTSERAPAIGSTEGTNTTTKPSTADKLMAKIGMK